MSRDRIVQAFSACFINEKYIWKLLCLCCTVLLLMWLFRDFFWIKPTVTTVEKIKLSQDIFPNILVCREMGFDQKQLESHGYQGPFGYFTGFDKNNTFIGWSGLDNKDPLRKAFKQYFLFNQ